MIAASITLVASITLAAAIYLSFLSVGLLVGNIINGVLRTNLQILKRQDPKLRDVPDLNRMKPLWLEPLLACVLWGVFFYLTR